MNLAEHTALSPEEYRAQQQLLKKQQKRGYGLPSAASSRVGSAAERRVGDASAADAYREFLCNCRALSLKANTALSQQAAHIRSGTTVDLTDNYIGAAGLQAMSPLVAANTQLCRLKLPNNGITNDALVFLCRAIKEGGARGGSLSTLASLDLSRNPAISLPGGLALLSLVQHQDSVLVEIDLTDTQVPPPLQAKIAKALAVKAQYLQEKQHRHPSNSAGAKPPVAISTATAAASPPPAAAATAAPKGTDEQTHTGTAASEPARDRKTRWCAKWEENEAEQLRALRARLLAELQATSIDATAAPLKEANALDSTISRCNGSGDISEGEKALVPVPVDVHTGWRVIEVPILAPAGLFDSEVDILTKQVFPKLNIELQSRRVALIPLVHDGRGVPLTLSADGKVVRTASAAPRRASGTALSPHLRQMHFTVGCDVLADVRRSRFLTIELVGDRPGSYEQPPAAAMVRTGHTCVDPQQQVSCNDALEALSTTTMAVAQPAPPLHPVMHAAHDAAIASARWLLIATRVGTGRIAGLPAPLAPLLSAQPDVEHPDRHRALVKRVAATASVFPGGVAAVPTATSPHMGAAPAVADRVFLTPAVEEKQWREHETFRTEVVAAAPTPELVVADYPAAFAGVDANGCVRLTDLECFTDAVYSRLHLLCTTLFPSLSGPTEEEREQQQMPQDANRTHGAPPVVGENRSGRPSVRAQTQCEIRAVVNAIASSGSARAMVKKALSNRLNVYIATPPSRNSLVLHGPDRAPLTAALAAAAARLMAVPFVYTVAYHSCYSTRLLSEEPSDLRGVILAIMNQLTPNPAVRQYVRCEVDLARLQSFFANFLAGTKPREPAAAAVAAGVSGGASATVPQYWGDVPAITATTLAEMEASASPKGSSNAPHVYVVLLDGVDAMEAPVEPCAALRRAVAGGVDEWAELLRQHQSPSQDAAAAPTAAPRTCRKGAVDDFLPRCLARNVRLVVSCGTQSEALLEHLSQLGRDSAEVVGIGASSVNDVEQLLSPGALSGAGVELSHDDFALARDKTDARLPEYSHYLIDCLRLHKEEPGFMTQTELLQKLPETLPGMAQVVYDRLTTAFPLPMVRRALGLLRCARWGLPLPVLRALLRQLSPQELQRFLRLLRPALEAPRGALLSSEDGNALDERVRLAAPSFLALLDRMDLNVADPNGPLEDCRTWHRALAHHYLDLVHRALVSPGRHHRHDHVSSSVAPPEGSALFGVEAAAPALLRFAVKELPYHLAEGGLWTPLDNVVLSMPFLELVYSHGLGYHFLRDLISAFNTRHDLYLLGEDVFGSATAAVSSSPVDRQESDNVDLAAGANDAKPSRSRVLPAVLQRHRDYVLFARAHGRKLMEYPHLVVQVALERPATVGAGSVQADAQAHTLKERGTAPPATAASQPCPSMPAREQVYLTATNVGRKAPIHFGALSAMCSVNNRSGKLFFVTAASDRTLCWVDANAGGAVAFHSRHPTARIEQEIVTRTGAYVGVLAEDRTVYVCDANNGSLVSRNDGALFRAPVADFVFSAGGRYYFVATQDTTVRVFDSEKGFEHFALKASTLLDDCKDEEVPQETVLQRAGVSRAVRVVPHPLDDELFLTIADGHVRVWCIGAGEESASAAAAAPVPAGAVAAAPLTRGVRLHDSFSLNVGSGAVVASAEWLPISAVTQQPVRREELGAEALSMSSWTSAPSEAVGTTAEARLVCPYIFLHTKPQRRRQARDRADDEGDEKGDAVTAEEVVAVFDLNAGATCARRFTLPPLRGSAPEGDTDMHSGGITVRPRVQHCTVTPDGAWLAVALHDGRIAVYTIASGRPNTAKASQPAVCVLDGFKPRRESKVEAQGRVRGVVNAAVANSPNNDKGDDDDAEVRVPILGVAFHYDLGGHGAASAPPTPSVFAVGNEREVKYWCCLEDAVAAPGVPEGEEWACSGEFVLDTPATCFASGRVVPSLNRPAPPVSTAAGAAAGQEEAVNGANDAALGAATKGKDSLKKATASAELAVGDGRGCVVVLGYWQPSVL